MKTSSHPLNIENRDTNLKCDKTLRTRILKKSLNWNILTTKFMSIQTKFQLWQMFWLLICLISEIPNSKWPVLIICMVSLWVWTKPIFCNQCYSELNVLIKILQPKKVNKKVTQYLRSANLKRRNNFLFDTFTSAILSKNLFRDQKVWKSEILIDFSNFQPIVFIWQFLFWNRQMWKYVKRSLRLAEYFNSARKHVAS